VTGAERYTTNMRYRVVFEDREGVRRHGLLADLHRVIYLPGFTMMSRYLFVSPPGAMIPAQMLKVTYRRSDECDYIDGHLVHIYRQEAEHGR